MADISSGRPKTAREEAAAADRSKREAEMDELRRLRAEQAKNDESEDLSPADRARKKREEEMAELRRLKAGENDAFRRSLEKGGALTTDMNAFQMKQMNAKRGDRSNKLAAQSNLAGFRGAAGSKTAAEIDREAQHQAQRDQMAKMGQLNLDGDNMAPDVDAGEGAGVKEAANALEAAERAAAEKSAVEKAAAEKAAAEKAVAEKAAAERAAAEKALAEKAAAEKAEEEKAAAAAEKKKKPRGSVMFKEAEEMIPAAEVKAPPERRLTAEMMAPDNEGTSALKAPTYGRVDIKFSFGLIVRSSAADGFETENLRDNETLKKCMEGTSKILKDEMPNPPDTSKMDRSSFTSFKIKFPEAYYDPTLEPTVISIEEDKKAAEEGKVTAKGNKRTLVKASFPVFLRDEAVDEEGKKRSARMLKETKTTVFKALRAAVSGGSFLR